MTRPIDEKIVVMKLDNSDFKRKATETTGLFGKIKESIGKLTNVDISKTTQSISQLSSNAEKVNLDRLNNSLQAVTNKFTTLGMVGVTALTNITNRAIDSGIALSKNLTLDQITSGFQEYETKIKSIGTVLSNTEWAGTTLEDVKRVLEELNVYADNTVYSFGQMTENIGRWTAAGVKIDDAATAIKGLSNLAAASGSNVEQLNTAMYQMSQGMAANKFGLEDWNSMVNAGMGGKKTQDALLATAKAMGKNVDMSEGFRLSLSKGWLTADVFLETMKKFGNDKSMTEAATAVRTFSAMMDSLKESIGSGWAMTFEYIFGDFEEATVFWTNLAESVTGFFSKSTESRNKLMSEIADQKGFITLFDGLQNAVKPLIQIFDAMGDGLDRVFPPATADKIVSMTKSFKSFTDGLKLSNATVEKLTTIFQGGFSVLSTVLEITKQLGSTFLNLIPDNTGSGMLDLLEKMAMMSIRFNESVKEGNFLTATIKGLGIVLGAIIQPLTDVVSGAATLGSSLMNNLAVAIDWVVAKLKPVRSIFEDSFSDFGGDDALGAGMLGAIIILVSKISGLFDNFGDMTDGFKETLEGVTESVQAFATGIKIVNLVMIAGALTMIAVSLKLLEGVKTEDITKGVTALAASLAIMMVGLAVISKFNMVGGIKASATIIALAASVTIMAVALKTISDLDSESMKTGLGGLVVIVGALIGAVTILSKFGGSIVVSSLQLVALSSSIVILASAVKLLSTIDASSLKASTISLGIIFTELAIFMKVVSGTKISPTSMVGLIAVSGAILVMTQAIKQISNMDVESLTKGLVTIGLVLTQLALFSKLAGGPQVLLASTGLLLIAGAINAMIPPIKTLGDMTYEELAKGLTAMALALVAVAGAGLLANGAIGGAVAITIIAGALNLLMGPIKAMSQLTWGEIITGIGGLALTMGALAGVAALLTPLIPSMLGFSAAVTVMGVGMLAAGAGVALFGTGLATLATMTAASITAIISAFALLLKGLGSLIPSVVTFVVELGSALIDGIAKLGPKISDATLLIVTSLLETIQKYLPRFLEAGIGIIIQLINGIGEYTPQLVDAGIGAIVSLIQGLSDAVENNSPQLISSILDLLGEIILLIVEAGVQTVNALLGWLPGVKEATAAIGTTAEEYIRENFGAEDVGSDKGEEFASGLLKTKESTKNAGKALANAGKDGVSGVKMEATGEDFGGGFIQGIKNTLSKVVATSKSLAQSALTAMRTELDTHSPSKETDKIGQDTGQGFSNGMKKKTKTVKKTAAQVASEAKAAFKEKMDEAEYKFEMGEIDTKKYISSIEKIRDAYSRYRELVREANLEIKKIKDKEVEESIKRDEERIKRENEQFKKQWDSRKALIDERKYYNQMSITQELATWERLMNSYKEGTEQRKEAEREVYRLKNDINKQLIALNDEYANKVRETNAKLLDDEIKLRDEYYAAVTGRSSELTNWVGLFNEVKKSSESSGKDLLRNLKDQVKTLEDWAEDIEQLAKKGIDEGLLEELRNMGPSAFSEIHQLTRMTRSQLEEYSNLWVEKNKTARELAIGELEWLRTDTDNKIKELRTDAASQLEIYKQEWITKMREIRFGTESQFVGLDDNMRDIGKRAIDNLINGIKDMEGTLVKNVNSVVKSISNSVSDTLKIDPIFTPDIIDNSLNKLKASSKQSITKLVDGLDSSSKDKSVKLKAVTEYDAIDSKKLNVNTSFVSATASAIQTKAQHQSQLNSNNNANLAQLGKTITKSIEKLQNNDNSPTRVVVPVYLDGNVITEVVSEKQNKQLSLAATTKGVIFG